MFSLTTMLATLIINDSFMISPVIPPEAGQGWKLDFCEIIVPLETHYHKAKRQYAVVMEGELHAFRGNEEPMILHDGELNFTEPGVKHALIPKGRVRFFTIDLPGFVYPEDFFWGEPDRAMKPITWSATNPEFIPPLDEKYFGPRIEKGDYAVYDLMSGAKTGGKWSVALLDIKDSPKHFHQIEMEQFVVVNGTLDIEVEEKQHIIKAGESILVEPKKIHRLKSASTNSVRVLCFSFPAFNPADMHCIQ
jgi:quercetin dioxygenase-like cupin family protein